MLFGMPAESFFAFAIWPVVWIVAAIILYSYLKKTDELEDKNGVKE